MARRLLPNWASLITVVYCLQSAAVLAENRRDIKIPCGGATVTEQIALKVSEAGATWTVRVYAGQGCQFKKSTATIVEGLTAVNWNSPHVAEHVTEVTYQVRVTDQSNEGKMTISGELEPRPGSGGGGGQGGGGSGGSGQPKTFSVTVLLRVVELEFTSPANGAPLSVCVGGSANLTVLVRVGDGRAPSTGTVTWQVSTGLPGTTPSPTPLQEGIAETTFTSNGSLTSGAGTITAQAKDLKDADGKPMPDVSATVPGYVVKVTGITPANPVCELGDKVVLTVTLDPPNAPAPTGLIWSVEPATAGTFNPQSGSATTDYDLDHCAKVNPKPRVKVTCGTSRTPEVEITPTADTAVWEEWNFNLECPDKNTGPCPQGPETHPPAACVGLLKAWCACDFRTLYFLWAVPGQADYEVGKCCFSCAQHRFFYKHITKGGKTRVVKTFHYVSDVPLNIPGAVCWKDSKTQGEWDWRVRQRDLLNDNWDFDNWGHKPINEFNHSWSDPKENTKGILGGAAPCGECPCPTP